MERFEKSNDRPESGHEQLKRRLMDGSIAFEDVEDALYGMDQVEPMRGASETNLRFLRNPDIVAFVEKHPDAAEGYHRIMSLTEFHVAQRIASIDPENATDHFKEALNSARFDTSGNDWAAYVQGTIMYMEGKGIPEHLIASAGTSAQVLRNLNAGLKERGYPSYDDDYNR